MSLQTNTDDSQARLDKVIAEMTEEWRKERSETQMTLGGLIDRLSELDPEMTMKGLCDPDSYRGYYSDLAFDVSGDRKVRDVLDDARESLGKTFEGYKGGEFRMDSSTPVWIAKYGRTGVKIMSISDNGEVETAEDDI